MHLSVAQPGPDRRSLPEMDSTDAKPVRRTASLRCPAFLSWMVAASAWLFVATAWAAPVPSDHGCMGRWVGTGRNTGSSTEWTIDLTLTSAPSGGRCGTIEYTNPACGGTLESCELVDGEIHTREDYTHNDGACAPAGRVLIRCDGDTMRYSWIGWERVDSTLHRAGAGPTSSNPSPSGGSTPTPGPSGTSETPSASDRRPDQTARSGLQPTPNVSRTSDRQSSNEPGLLDKLGCGAFTGALHAGLLLPAWLVWRGRRRRAPRRTH